MTVNDERIMNLRVQIENKERELSAAVPFRPKTHCSLSLFGEKYNIHTLDIDQASYLLLWLNCLKISAEDLAAPVPHLGGYSIAAWIDDLRCKIADISVRHERAKLAEMHKKLESLLSAEKQTELAIDEIEGLL